MLPKKSQTHEIRFFFFRSIEIIDMLDAYARKYLIGRRKKGKYLK